MADEIKTTPQNGSDAGQGSGGTPIYNPVSGTNGFGSTGRTKATMAEKDSDMTNDYSKDGTYSQQSSHTMYHTFNDLRGSGMNARSLQNSRLWHGVPDLTEEQLKYFEAAYTGHQFFFVTGLPKFMISGMYADENTNMHQHAINLKSIIEKCCTSFNDGSSIQVQPAEQTDGNGRKITHFAGATKEDGDITLNLHEFAGMPLKNALETWVTGVMDPKVYRGHYFGNLGIDGGWCLANHTMSLLVVQTDPSWTEIQDCAWYCNMFPNEVNFDYFNYEKGASEIVPDQSISFNCNQIRSAQVIKAAEAFMNNKILNMVNTCVYNPREFSPLTNTMSYANSESNTWANNNYTVNDNYEYGHTQTTGETKQGG